MSNEMNKKIWLLGDSVFDNAPYVKKGEAVIEVLKNNLKANAELLAKDGGVISSLPAQAQRLPQGDLTNQNIFISAGGNNAVPSIGVLETNVAILGEAFFRFREIKKEFEAKCVDYRDVVRGLLARNASVDIFTIYEGNFEDMPGLPSGSLNQAIQVAISVYNDVIYRTFNRPEFHNGNFRIHDLRDICNEPADFTKKIEPSAQGAIKIAGHIMDAIKRGNEQ